MSSYNQQIQHPLLKQQQVALWIKREDLLHPIISGNKFRKLKYNIKDALALGQKTILTFGGAYSNHIVATACAAKEAGLKAIGVIRGEELKEKWKTNPTLEQAAAYGMQFLFVTREAYRLKTEADYILKLKNEFGDFYLIPEGGTNALAVKGCEEILTKEDERFNFVACAVGTGGTVAGIINSLTENQHVLAYPALKGNFLKAEIDKFATNEQWQLVTDYHFGGYAKVTEPLVQFINEFKRDTGIPLDPIYTGKMLFGIWKSIIQGNFTKGTKILAIHTGGLQGIKGMNQQLRRRNLPVLDL
ncbi:1-aminocyclopropane-1-carboxylate deaminase [Croceivirga radicis]|uniref:1-aminocyclopropane-1-carboxylate deaminase n=1 Tax=Croceivirga radicis TaxID=1929488 RepID=A0A1V6LNT2_9FLAO|nr:pyridoxal-phosphate dependent enzyme [Croceivirga radicis]OQD41851.1 1-aminocyclopropane-1-carboxylate deaminase [Croceivirga radicis]